VTRNANLIPWEWLLEDLDEVPDCELYVDESAQDEIAEFLTSDKKIIHRFRLIARGLATGEINEKLYGPEKVSKKASDMMAMKFKGVNRLNPRIYCQDIIKNGRKIVMIHFLRNKATQKVDKKLKNKIELIGGYEYEFCKPKK
jgi:hypothetical protein